MIYPDTIKNAVLNRSQFNQQLNSKLNANNLPQEKTNENSNGEFFKTKLNKGHLIHFTSGINIDKNINISAEPNITYVLPHTSVKEDPDGGPDLDGEISAIILATLKNTLNKTNNFIPLCPGELNDQTKFVLNYFHVPFPEKLTDFNDRKYKNAQVTLVDCNDPKQTIENVKKDDIVEIYDHHKMTYDGKKPVLIHTEPVGATATMLTEAYINNNVYMPPKVAGLLYPAILSDTFNLASNATQKDKDMVQYLEENLRKNMVDPEKFKEKFLSKINVKWKRLNEAQIINYDMKKYLEDSSLTISQITVNKPGKFLAARKEKILKYMSDQENLHNSNIFLMVSDIKNEETYLLFTDKSKELVKEAFKEDINENLEERKNNGKAPLEDPNVITISTLSRKSKVEPKLVEIIGNLHKKENVQTKSELASIKPDVDLDYNDPKLVEFISKALSAYKNQINSKPANNEASAA